ncbi:outer membrane receptor protein involved in Fe transport [Dokdonia sp. Hel_I_63]|uniref:outer membrane beta-barrel family protein n=1 Tax=unclassified Dokdonia TaxID=2615033 RepID=UPI00020A6A0D|nr:MULTISPECIES: outer membrane beta-barrel family protein [unclassified Dokdonia]AEE19572.1 TonB-dependent receptor plug [Dokdonia sp. 4H-3-7-5]TVZ21200.1 outer membrane receptor protein involved in Fe transport [Dokdonia sp. Hel_I_63]
MKNFITFLLLSFSLVAVAQRPGGDRPDVVITGTVMEAETNIPLEYATVSFATADGKVVTGGITDPSGKYSIEIPAGVYDVKFEFISFETKVLPAQRLTKDTTLPTQTLAIDSQSLDEVIVRSETTEVQVRLDKKIYNIGKDLTTSGATVSDALSNVPSVTVDVDGAIALRGNGNVRILINGRPSAIAGFGSVDALSQLPADAIERVEVITSPSARYDAEGTAGILNIILKKEKTLGLNGSIQTNVGYPERYGITGNINLRTDKFNIFNTTGYSKRTSPGNAAAENQYFVSEIGADGEQNFTSEIDRILREDREFDRNRGGFNTNLGIEYFLTEKTSVTASGFLRLGDNDSGTDNLTNEFTPDNELTVSRTRLERENEEDMTYQFSLNSITKFDESGHELTAALQYARDEETETSIITEFNSFPTLENLPTEAITQIENQKEYLAQVDYVRPIGETAQFELGYRGNFEETETDYTLLEEDVAGGTFIRDNGLSNIFTYKEDVHAFYTQYGDKFGDFSFLAGLRYENTRQQGTVDAVISDDNPLGTNLDFDNQTDGLFPTLNLTYEFNERENITLGFNRRINRPRGRFINPFPSRSSEANIFQGNPDLVPSFASAYDLGYLKRWDKLTLTSSVYYQYETDSFERIQEDTGLVTANGVPIIRTLPINLSTNERYGAELGVLYNPNKWLRLNLSANAFLFETNGSFNGVDYGASNFSFFTRGSAKVSLPYKIDWQTNIFYRGPSNNAQTDTEGFLFTNLAFSKDILNDNATLALNVSDVFNSSKRQSFTTTDSFTSDSEFQFRVRSVNLAFTYRFNQKKKRERGSRGGGEADDDFEG